MLFCVGAKEFLHEYDTLTEKVAAECESAFLEDYMIVGTSSMIQTELDSIVNQYTDQFCNPMVMWGKYRKQSAATLAEKIGISAKAVEKQLTKLKAEGLIDRKGPAKGGKWVVK